MKLIIVTISLAGSAKPGFRLWRGKGDNDFELFNVTKRKFEEQIRAVLQRQLSEFLKEHPGSEVLIVWQDTDSMNLANKELGVLVHVDIPQDWARFVKKEPIGRQIIEALESECMIFDGRIPAAVCIPGSSAFYQQLTLRSHVDIDQGQPEPARS